MTHPPLALAKKFFVPSYLCSSNTRDRLKLAGLLEPAGVKQSLRDRLEKIRHVWGPFIHRSVSKEQMGQPSV